MSTTKEQRMYNHWKEVRGGWVNDYPRRESIGELWKHFATFWRMSVRQAKVIIATVKENPR